MLRTVVILAALSLGASAALAEDLTFDVENASSSAVTEFYTSPVGVKDWENNMVASPLQPGDSAEATIGDGRDVCEYDIHVVFADGSNITDENVDLCSLGAYTVSDDG